MQWETSRLRSVIGSGAVSGMLAGALMGMWMMGKSASADQGFWTPISTCMASFAYPGWAKHMMEEMMMMAQNGQSTHATFEGIHGVVGLALHMGASAMFGLVFAFGIASFKHVSTAGTIAAGIAYGLAIWAVMQLAVLPLANEFMIDNIRDMVGTWVFVVAHLIFGMALGASIAFVRVRGLMPDLQIRTGSPA